MSGTTPLKQLGFARVMRSLLLLRLLLIAGMVLSAQFAWLLSHAEKWDTPSQIPALFLCELPLAFSLYFLIAGDPPKRGVRGAGVTFGVALGFCLVSPLLFFMLMMTIWDSGSRYVNLTALQHFLPVCLILSLLATAMAWTHAKDNRGSFVKAAGAGAGCFGLTLVLIFVSGLAGSGDSKAKASFLTTRVSSSQHATAIAACLIRYRSLHPEQGFPASLQEIRSDWNCDAVLSDPAGLPGYWIFYSRVNESPGPGGKDFRVEVVPTEKGRNYQEVAAVDGRGEPLEFPGLNATAAQRGPHFSIQTVDGGGGLHILQQVQGNIRGYMETHDPLRAPTSLAGVVDPGLMKNGCERYDESELDPKTRVIHEPSDRLCYKIEYFPPSGTGSDTFAISVQCMSYGEACLRSYYLDYDDTKHATAEPREATAEDPGLQPCETAQVCEDTVWPHAQQASDWIFIKASLHDALHSTAW